MNIQSNLAMFTNSQKYDLIINNTCLQLTIVHFTEIKPQIDHLYSQEAKNFLITRFIRLFV